MKPSDGLRYDHDVLRGKLSSLELYLPSIRGSTVSRQLNSFNISMMSMRISARGSPSFMRLSSFR